MKVNVNPAQGDSLDVKIFDKFRHSMLKKADEFSSSENSKLTQRESQQNEIISRLKSDGELSTEDWRLLLLNRLIKEKRVVSVQEFSVRYAQSNLSRLEQEGLRRYRLELEIMYTKFHPWHETELLKLMNSPPSKKEANKIIFSNAAKSVGENRALVCVLDGSGYVYNINFIDN